MRTTEIDLLLENAELKKLLVDVELALKLLHGPDYAEEISQLLGRNNT